MGLGKYSPLWPNASDAGAVAMQPEPSRSRNRVLVIVLGALCFLESLALIWVAQSQITKSSSSSRLIFRDEIPFSTATTEEEVEHAWSVYGLPNSGFVHIQRPEELGLKPNRGVVSGVDNVYTVSAMHQLHCLKELQKMFVRGGAAWNSTAGQGPDEYPEVAQSPLRGWGVTHDCRSWKSLMEFRDRHSVGGW
ncbi:hypothetical protein PT974_05010 [Cladobotryum mycophilum]|uniref:Uncharacterized protein n=1 Tax=Cladobotryum mycophilum TaxID=491253 RepID=A0ABR0SRH5_9HYPO